MRGITARLARGASPPLHPQPKESLRALLWNLQSRGFPSPCTLDRAMPIREWRNGTSPSREISFSLGTHDRCFGGGIDQGLSCPLETRSGLATLNPGRHFGLHRPRRSLEPFILEGG